MAFSASHEFHSNALLPPCMFICKWCLQRRPLKPLCPVRTTVSLMVHGWCHNSAQNPCPDNFAGDSDDVLECQDLRDKLKARLPLCCCDFKASTWTNSHALQCSCRDSPFQAHDNFGGGFGMHRLSRSIISIPGHCMSSACVACVAMCRDNYCNSVKVMVECAAAASDGDRVALQSMRFATPRSAGATCMTLGQLSTIQNNDNGSAPARPEEAADDQVTSRTFCLQPRDMLSDHGMYCFLCSQVMSQLGCELLSLSLV